MPGNHRHKHESLSASLKRSEKKKFLKNIIFLKLYFCWMRVTRSAILTMPSSLTSMLSRSVSHWSLVRASAPLSPLSKCLGHIITLWTYEDDLTWCDSWTRSPLRPHQTLRRPRTTSKWVWIRSKYWKYDILHASSVGDWFWLLHVLTTSWNCSKVMPCPLNCLVRSEI